MIQATRMLPFCPHMHIAVLQEHIRENRGLLRDNVFDICMNLISYSLYFIFYSFINDGALTHNVIGVTVRLNIVSSTAE